MISQVEDFRAEAVELAALLETLRGDGWARTTQFKDWSVEDVVLHLYASDAMAMASLDGEAAFARLRADMLRARAGGASMIEESRRRFPDMRGTDLLRHWTDQVEALCSRLGERDPKERLPWSGPGMSLRMFATARQMETWAHGQEIYDSMGLARAPRDRLVNVATLGVRTFGWSFANRGLAAPPTAPVVRLDTPSGHPWVANEDGDGEVSGTMVEFCQVVTQVRNVGDTSLRVRGEAAAAWMRIAQCFAGPPADPPPPGTRFARQAASTF